MRNDIPSGPDELASRAVRRACAIVKVPTPRGFPMAVACVAVRTVFLARDRP
jgi:hypothetical protein